MRISRYFGFFGPLIIKAAYSPFPTRQIVRNNQLFNVVPIKKEKLSDAVDLALRCFFTGRLDDRNDFDGFMKYVVDYYKWSEKSDAWLSNYLGFWNRSGKRLTSLDCAVMRDTLIFGAYTKDPKEALKLENSQKKILVAMIELSLEPPKNKISPFLRNPFDNQLDPEAQPYIANLCVDSSYRKLGLAKELCLLCENISVNNWEKNKIYLHVGQDNVPAQKLYESLGFSRVGTTRGLNPGEVVIYYSKSLSDTNTV